MSAEVYDFYKNSAARKRGIRENGFRLVRGGAADHPDLQLRNVVCGFCGWESGMVDGPTGRALFAGHPCDGGKAAA